jgi:caffeoyl-CoA O-methyltransferase
MPIYNDALEAYLRAMFAEEDQVTSQIRTQIPEKGLPAITVRPEEGRFLQFLVASSKAKLALEIGTLGGYSGTWIARGLPTNGRLITLEMEPHHASVAQEHFKLAGVDKKVDQRVGNAHDLLREIEGEGPFDFIFIDAEKEGYLDYWTWTHVNLSVGGVLAAHNAFRHGRIVDPAVKERGVEVVRSFNQTVADDPRFVSMIFPAGDGMVIATKTQD